VRVFSFNVTSTGIFHECEHYSDDVSFHLMCANVAYNLLSLNANNTVCYVWLATGIVLSPLEEELPRICLKT